MADAQSTAGFYFDATKGRFRVSIQKTVNGKQRRRTRLLPDGTSASEAKTIADAMRLDTFKELVGLSPNSGWVQQVERALVSKGSWLQEMFKRARQRAKVKQREFSLTIEELTAMLLATNGKCAVSGLAFNSTLHGKRSKMRPFAPSIDRKDCTKGYTRENCRIVCSAVNVAMFTWGEDAFTSIAIGYVVNQVLAKNAPALHLGGGVGKLCAHLEETEAVDPVRSFT